MGADVGTRLARGRVPSYPPPVSTPKEPRPALLFLSVMSASGWGEWPGLKAELQTRFGPVEYESGNMAFGYTDYYVSELGAPIVRRLLGFERLVPQDSLAEAKLFTNALEAARSGPDGRRTFNLDPGLLTLERLVLATGKNFSHRIYLGHGLHADLTLVWQGGTWRSFDWTFPDYASEPVQARLTKLRNIYKNKLP